MATKAQQDEKRKKRLAEIQLQKEKNVIKKEQQAGTTGAVAGGREAEAKRRLAPTTPTPPPVVAPDTTVVGETPKDKSIDQQTELLKEKEVFEETEFQREKNRIESEIIRKQQDLERSKAIASSQFEGTESAVKGQAAFEPGTLSSSTNKALSQGILGGVSQRREQQLSQFNALQANITKTQENILSAEKSRDFGKRQVLLDEFAALEKQKDDLKAETDALASESAENVLDFIGTSDMSLLDITDEELIGLSEQTGLPPFLFRSIKNAQTSANKAEIKEAKQKAAAAIEKNMSSAARLFRDRKRLVDGGATESELAVFDKLIEVSPNTEIIKSGDDVYTYDPDTKKTTQIVGEQPESFQPTGELVQNTVAGRKVILDSGVMPSFAMANQAMFEELGEEIKIGGTSTSSFRDQAATISGMVNTWNTNNPTALIDFNSERPNDAAAALRNNGVQVANVGASKHENGLALDIFPDPAYIAKVKPFMEAEGWKQTIPTQDAGHFEYVGKPKKVFDAQEAVAEETKLRKEFTSVSKDFTKVRDAYNRILSSVDSIDKEAKTAESTAAGDLSLIFNYMKVLDPGSTVREGEFATAQNSAGIPEIIQSKYNQVIRGERLAPATRFDFVSRAEGLFKGAKKSNEAIEKQFRDLARSTGLDPKNVILDIAEVGEVSNIVASDMDFVNNFNKGVVDQSDEDELDDIFTK